jgi:hypothetical protein
LEFLGTIFRNLADLHDAAAEEWVSACGTNSEETVRTILADSTNEALSAEAFAGLGFECDGFSREMLSEAFERLRRRLGDVGQA